MDRERACWSHVQVELMRGDEHYRKLDAIYQQALAHHNRLADENSLLDEICQHFQDTRDNSGSLSAQLRTIMFPAPVPAIPPYDRWSSPYTGEKDKYPVIFDGKTAVTTARVLPLPLTGPVTPLYGGPASGVKHEAQEPAEDRAQREKLENLESLLSQVLLEVERRRDASHPRCYYHPQWENDPHELAKLDAIYQMREQKMVESIVRVEADLQGVVDAFDTHASRDFAQKKASGVDANWNLRTGRLTTQGGK